MAPRKKKSKETFDDDMEEVVAAPNAAQLKSIEELINRANNLQNQIVSLKDVIEAYTKEWFKITRHLIPDAMFVAGVNKFVTTNNLSVSIEDFIEGNLPKEDLKKRQKALQWLMDHGGADIIKGQIIIPFAKGQHNFKNEVKSVLKDIKADYREEEEVHHSSLKALVREKLRNAEEVPLDLLGLFVGRKAEIKNPDAKKKKKEKEDA